MKAKKPAAKPAAKKPAARPAAKKPAKRYALGGKSVFDQDKTYVGAAVKKAVDDVSNMPGVVSRRAKESAGEKAPGMQGRAPLEDIIKKRTPDTGSEPSTSMPKAPAKTAAGKKPLSAFEKAFAQARKDGEKNFTFGGKKYTTKYKGE